MEKEVVLCDSVEHAKTLLQEDGHKRKNREYAILERYVKGDPIVCVRWYRETGKFAIGTKPEVFDGRNYLMVDESQNFGQPVKISKDTKGQTVIEGNDGEKVVFENVEGKPNENAVLPKYLVKALELKMKYRMIGVALEMKIPMYEKEGKQMYLCKTGDESIDHIYITKYDLIRSPGKDLIKSKEWCLYIERKLNDEKIVKAGLFFSDTMLMREEEGIVYVKSLITDLITHLNKKYNDVRS